MSLTSTAGKRMLGYLPPLYEGARVFQEFLQVQGAELDQMRDTLPQLLEQFFPQTATWGLDLWEEELGLPPAVGQTDAERRSRILGRLRGYGTLTIKLLTQVAEAYDNGRVEVTPDFPAATMVIRFVDTRGVPSNIEDLQAEIRRLVPARYEVEFEFRYLTWDELDSMDLTWDELDAMQLTWEQFESMAYVHPGSRTLGLTKAQQKRG